MRVRQLIGLTAVAVVFFCGTLAPCGHADSISQTVTAAAPPQATTSLTRTQQQALTRLVATNPDAHALFAQLQQTAREALAETPRPIALIQSEGKLPQDPLKIATVQSLGDMPRAEALAWTAAVTEDPDSSAAPDAVKAKDYVLAWADTNRSKGDPIDDTNLESLFVAYDLVRGTFSTAEQARVEQWLRQIVAQEQRTGRGTGTNTHNNWNSHRLKVIGLAAFLLRDPQLIAAVVDGYRRQVGVDLNPDGSSFDFHERDALHYHLYTLQPLLTLAIAARRNGIDLYDYQAPSGASLAKSLQFLVAYCHGTKTHGEFTASRVAFDRKRAEAGDPEYRAGRLFDPHEALPTLALAAAFDVKYGALERSVSGQKTSRFASWQDVLNTADR